MPLLLRLTGMLVILAAGCGPEYDPNDAKFESGGFESTAVVKVERPAPPALAEAGVGVLREGDVMWVGFWNIQWLDSNDKRFDHSAQKAEDLADYIAASKVDVLGVSEIGAVIAEGAWRSITLERVIEILSAQGHGAWRYMLFPNSDDDLRQLTGILWNGTRVQMIGWRPAEIDRTKNDEIWHRHPAGVKFSAGRGLSDLIVIPIHMRCCLAVEERRLEAEALVAAMPGLESALIDADVLIIGDANMWKHDEPAGKAYAKGGFGDLNRRDRATHAGGFPFDRAFVRARGPELEGTKLQVFGVEYLRPKRLKTRDFQKRYSDHFLIRVPVKVSGDDD